MPSDREPDKAITDILTQLAAQVRAQARAEGFRDGLERAAQECDAFRDRYDTAGDEYDEHGAVAAISCAAAIRALAPVPDQPPGSRSGPAQECEWRGGSGTTHDCYAPDETSTQPERSGGEDGR